MLERLNQEIKRRTHVVRIFPNAESCLRLVRALAVETHENWLEASRYLNMDHLKEHKKRGPAQCLGRLTAAGVGARLRDGSATRAPAKAQRAWSEFAEKAGHYSLTRAQLAKGRWAGPGRLQRGCLRGGRGRYGAPRLAGVAELVDALDSKSSSGDRVSVRSRPPAPRRLGAAARSGRGSQPKTLRPP